MLYLIRIVTLSRAKLVYEIADIHPALTGEGLKSKLIRCIERFLVRRSRVVVFTSPAFRTGYFHEIQNLKKFDSVVIEHKVSLDEGIRKALDFGARDENPLTIGYIGLMKSPVSFSFLTRLAEKGNGRIFIRFHGRFVPPLTQKECLSTIERSPYLEYRGPYDSPGDLEIVYEGLDMVWDAYQEGANAQWQRTTRFSEACFFKKPLLYHLKTQDGKLADLHNLGIGVSFESESESIDQILSIDKCMRLEWHKNLEKLPREMIFYGDEYSQLVTLLEQN